MNDFSRNIINIQIYTADVITNFSLFSNANRVLTFLSRWFVEPSQLLETYFAAPLRLTYDSDPNSADLAAEIMPMFQPMCL